MRGPTVIRCVGCAKCLSTAWTWTPFAVRSVRSGSYAENEREKKPKENATIAGQSRKIGLAAGRWIAATYLPTANVDPL
jgi:hypothetical protein